MNLQQARFIVAVAKLKSFTKAAEACSVTQPALSNSINQFEEQLGGKVFSRTTRSVKLTELGSVLLDDIKLMLSTRDRVLGHAANFLRRDDNTIRVGLSPLLNDEYLTLFMERMRNHAENVQIVVTELNWSDIESALENGTVDLGFGPKPLDKKKLRTLVIHEEPLLYISDQLSDPSSSPIHFDQLAEETMLLVQDSCGLANTVRILFDQNSVDIKEYEGRALGYSILEKWVHLGLGATLLPASKVTGSTYARPIVSNKGELVPIIFQAYWDRKLEAKSCFASVRQGLLDSSQSLRHS